jgi:hypothetical protein
MSGRDHHRALKTEVVGRLNAGRAQMVLAALQAGKSDKWFTLHVNPTSFSTAGLQPTDWLAYLGFRRNDQCSFTEFQRCYSREVPQEFDFQQFATAFNAGFGYLEKAQDGLRVCGFMLPQPEGWGFYSGRSGGSERRRYHAISGDGHTAMKKDAMKATEDEQFLFRFTFIHTGGEEAFVTHYRPKHSPISSELHSVFSYLGLKAFDDCPEFDFERCYFRTLRLEARDDDPWNGNVEYAHRCFDAHQAQFSPAIENLLAANAAVEDVGITFLPFEKAGARLRTDIASNVLRTKKRKPAEATPSTLPDSFDVAISFAGTERAEAEKLAGIVREAGYDVFYDNFYAEQLWGKNLTVFFDEIFRKRARFCVIFVSEEYRDRKWTIHEARSAQARALEERGNEYILPIRVDDIELDGLLPTIGYVPLNAGIERIGEMLVKKLQSPASGQ